MKYTAMIVAIILFTVSAPIMIALHVVVLLGEAADKFMDSIVELCEMVVDTLRDGKTK